MITSKKSPHDRPLCRGRAPRCQLRVKPSPSPSPSVTPTPAVSPSLSPSPSPTPSSAPPPSPSASPTPAVSPSPSPSPPQDPPGEGWTGTAGPAGVTCPLDAQANVYPGENLQDSINHYPGGTTFCVRRGIYRLSHAIQPRAGDVLVFEDGAILNGSKLVTDWTFNGIDWVATGQSQSIPPPKNLRCDIDRVQCEFEDLFKNDLPMRRVLSRAEVGSGQFYFGGHHHQLGLGGRSCRITPLPWDRPYRLRLWHARDPRLYPSCRANGNVRPGDEPVIRPDP